ncbi:HAMP domain-containing protein, partial [Phenylobacterium sp.]|uniref:HAMP domain-containing protein n=1 Tax=Phenylobacterium sp. TaxID=1871053 RepID=UPI00121A91B3
MSGWRRARPTGSLFVQLATLVGLALVLAEAINVLLLYNLPPPTPDFYRLSEIEQTFRGQTPTFADRPSLQLRTVEKAPGPLMEGDTAARIRAQFAKDLGTPLDQVVIAADRGPFADRRVGRIIRDRIAREGVREEHFLVAPFDVALHQPDGRWRVVRPQPMLGLNPWQQRIALWFVVSALAMAPVAYVFARRLSRPISLFAEAAERLGRDPRAEPLVLSGPSEIGVAVRAFNDMQERLRRYVEDRTAMVGAIAHDLRTPLTRMRFRIESLPDDQKAKMSADIDQMEEICSRTRRCRRSATASR